MSVQRADSPSWTERKRQGDAAELAVAEYFKQRDCLVAKTLGLDRFDLLVQSRLEIKHDLQGTTTGNVAIEIAFNGRPSGLSATSADRFVVVVGDTAFLSRTGQLRALIDSGNFRTVPAGDGKRATVRLVPVTTLQTLDMFQKLDLSEWLP